MPTFTTPTTDVKNPRLPKPFSMMSTPVASTVLKSGGFYRTVRNPSAEDVEAADVAYLGGRTYTISADEAAELTAAGYEVAP